MKLNEYGEIRIPLVKKGSSMVAKKDRGAPDRTITRPPRPDRGGGSPRPDRDRPDRGFENDLPGEPIVPDRDDRPGSDEPGEVIVPDRD